MTLGSKDTRTGVAGRARGGLQISAAASLNYSVAKVLSIFMVLLGHWFAGTILWVPVTFGLIIFAFSSAYFTGRIYGVDVDKPAFLRKKLERLGLRFWVILGFLATVLLIMQRPVLHWHSLIHLFGLSGFLNWFQIPNQSALGGGLWFFTLLLMFYVSYPYLASLCKTVAGATAVGLVTAATAVLLHHHVPLSHALWLTGGGFIIGVAFSMHEVKVHSRWALAAALMGMGLLVLAQVVKIKELNPSLILWTSLAICVWLASAGTVCIPIMKRIASLEKYLLEIFLIHMYLFIHPTGNTVVDLALSIVLIMIAAVGLHMISSRLSERVFAAPVGAR